MTTHPRRATDESDLSRDGGGALGRTKGTGEETMHPEKDRPAPASATRRNLIVLPSVVAVAALAVFVLRDSFAWGDVLGALVIGLGVFAVLVVLRHSARR